MILLYECVCKAYCIKICLAKWSVTPMTTRGLVRHIFLNRAREIWAIGLLLYCWCYVHEGAVFVQFQVERFWSFAVLLIGNAMCQIFPTSSVSSVQDDKVVAGRSPCSVHDFWLIKGSVGIDLFRGSRNSSVGMDSFLVEIGILYSFCYTIFILCTHSLILYC